MPLEQKPQQVMLPLSQGVPFAEQQSPLLHTPEQHWAPVSQDSSSAMHEPQLLAVDLVPNSMAGAQSELHAVPAAQHRTTMPSPVRSLHWV
jgi:hypothetical protein